MPSKSFKRAVSIDSTGARVVAKRAKGTKLYGFKNAGVAFTGSELIQARKRFLEAQHIRGLGKKKIKRAYKGLFNGKWF